MTKQRKTNGVRRSWTGGGRLSFRSSARLTLESLEDRSLLSADPLHNSTNADDVNGDGRLTPLDLLDEINYLNNMASSRSELSSASTPQVQTAVAASSGASSGSASSGTVYPDVLGTGTVTPLDALALTDAINQQTATANDLVEVSLEAVNASGTPINTIQVGQTFYLAAFTTDLETGTNQQGVYAMFTNVSYNSSLAEAAQGTGSAAFTFENASNPSASPPQLSNAWSIATSASSSTPGQITDAGAVNAGITNSQGQTVYGGGAVGAPSEVWTIPVTATAAGTLTFTPSSSDASGNTPQYDIDVYSSLSSVSPSDVDFEPVSITITSEPSVSVGAASQSNSTTGTTTLDFPVTLSTSSTAATVVTYSTSDGTAVSGTDYTGVQNGTITIPAGSTTGEIPITILQAGAGQVGETNKTFSITLNSVTNSATGATLGTATATGTIINTDFPTVTLSAAASETAPQSGSGTYNFTATLSQASQVPITLNYSTANGTGTSGVDYTGVTSGSVTIPAGSTTATIPITIFNDPSLTTATFSVALSSTSTNVTLGSPATATGTIDDLPALTVATPAAITAPTSGTETLTFTVNLSQDAPVGGATLDYATANGTALAGTEYTTANSSVTIPQGSNTATFSITILAPTVYEGQTAFTVNLSLPGTETDVALGTTSVTGTINPGVAEPVVSVATSAFDDPVGTGTSNDPFTISLSAASGVATTVNYATSDGTAKAGTDYTSTSGTATIPAGQTSVTINVPVTEYNVNEATKTFTMTLSSPTNATLSPTAGTAQAQIINQVPEPTISLNTPVYTDVTSGTGELPVVVSLSSASGQAITFDYATSDGTAIAGTNYTSTSGIGTIAAGQTSTTIDVPVAAEAHYAPSLNFTFTISSVSNATIANSATTLATTATINSSAAEPSLSIGNYSAGITSSSTTTFPFTVTLSAPSSVATTVTYATSNGTATAGVDYTAASGTLTIPAGQTTGTIDVTVAAETITTDKTFTLTLSSPTNATISTATATGTLLAYLPSSFSGYVFLDVNENGVKESGETVLPGVTISLAGTSSVTNTAVSMSTTTSSSGAYTFTNLTPGTYLITETAPSGYTGAEALPGDSNVAAEGTTQLQFTVTGLGNLTSVNDNFAFYGQSASTISQRGYLSSSATTAGTTSVTDVAAASGASPGQRSMLAAASGSSADAASNMVLSGSTLTVTGDGGNDSFSFTAGATVDTVTFNGVSSTYNAASLKSVVFNGTGEGSATLTGLGATTANLGLGSGTLTGAGYTVTVNNVNAVTVNGGGPGSTAVLRDSSLVDHLFASGDLAMLSDSSGDTTSIDGFASVVVQSASGGSLTKDVRSIDFALSHD